MKSKRTAPSRRRISFAVDRDDIDVNSDWVEAVMALPVAATPSDARITSTSGSQSSQDHAADAKDPPASDPNPQTATIQEPLSEESSAAVADNASDADNATDQKQPTTATDPSDESASPGDHEFEEYFATVAETSPLQLRRTPRPRILNRITDGLTPGQYAVYRVMHEEGERCDDDRARIFRGGYADLGRLTGMSKRGIQNVVGELQAKKVIRIHQKPGHHRTETSAYVVPDAERVLETWLSNGWRHAAGKSKVLTA
jgi:hypothetical protein